jgi:hypothetical protein
MAQLTDTTSCIDFAEDKDGALSPFYALSYHFGMLLGVDDFATEQAYHRGKMRLHNAWLHRAGVVWGFNVLLDKAHGEIRVTPGLALDAAGRELHLDADACVNVGEWFLAHQGDQGFAPAAIDNGFQFDAHVEIRYKSCLTRQVPALLEPCDGASAGTAYSRVFETVDIRLAPNKAPAAAAPPYHRLRVLFGLEPPVLPADQDVAKQRADILALSGEQQASAYVQALRKLAALDGIDLQPFKNADGESLSYPGSGDEPIVLADIANITITRSSETDPFQLTGGDVDVTVRPSLVATAAIQELLCGPEFRNVGAVGATIGPRVVSAAVSDTEIRFELDKDVEPQSIAADSIAVNTFAGGGSWQDVSFMTTLTSDPPAITLQQLKPALPAGSLVRLVVRGTGPKPVLGTNLAPLAGAAGGPDPLPHDGLDFVYMEKRS